MSSQICAESASCRPHERQLTFQGMQAGSKQTVGLVAVGITSLLASSTILDALEQGASNAIGAGVETLSRGSNVGFHAVSRVNSQFSAFVDSRPQARVVLLRILTFAVAERVVDLRAIRSAQAAELDLHALPGDRLRACRASLRTRACHSQKSRSPRRRQSRG